MEGAMFSPYGRTMKNKIFLDHEALGRTRFQCRTNPRQRILVVEDDDDVRRFNFEVLIRSGYNVDAAEDGAAGWDALQLEDYHLLITDNDMPKVSGVDLVKKLHSAHKLVPVIMAAGTSPQEELNRHPWLQIEAMLLKPYTIEQLLATVDNVLRVADGVGPLPDWKSRPSPNVLRYNNFAPQLSV